jgi:hypothetical protein
MRLLLLCIAALICLSTASLAATEDEKEKACEDLSAIGQMPDLYDEQTIGVKISSVRTLRMLIFARLL